MLVKVANDRLITTETTQEDRGIAWPQQKATEHEWLFRFILSRAYLGR